jgi:nucleoside 2-deoxyribosyltransferase|tara:strand:- start:112 stop:549 length:438 start_codon:yes stop_codon:yes gene_type:complete
MTLEKITIYLAGPFTNPDWRDKVKEQAPQHNYIDPRNNEQSSSATVTRDDLINGVEKSNMVFAYFPKGCKDTGTDIELGTAFGNRIPITLVNENEFQHPLLAGVAKRHLTSLEGGITYLNNLTSLDQPKEFEAAYKTISDLNAKD